MNSKVKIISFLLCVSLLLTFAGCNKNKSSDSGNATAKATAATTAAPADDSASDSEMFTQRDKDGSYDEASAVKVELSDSGIKCDSDSVTVSRNTVTVKAEGTYLFTGTLTNGQITVDADKADKLQLVLKGVNINCDTSAAIYVKQADKVFVTLAEGSSNTLSNKSEFVAIDDNNIDSVIFSKDDLTLNGNGSLSVNAVYGHGIVAKDDLVLTGGSYNITAQDHALTGNDSVRIADGSYTLNGGKDGIHSENTEDASLGFVYIAGGMLDITSGGDGIDGSGEVNIAGGELVITAGGGSANATVKTENMEMPGRRQQYAVTEDTDTVSTKGIKADGNITIKSGSVNADSADDAIHSNGNFKLSGGKLELASGDDGIHADSNVEISGGEAIISKSYEGIEGQTIDITGGAVSVVSSDDGLNAAGGNDQSGMGGDQFAADENSYIKISGGIINVNALGDGVDSNGNLYVSGGETYVSGPTNSGNGALDYDGEAQITGGVFVAVGASGMAEGFGSSSTQGAMLVNISATQISGEVSLTDSSGNVLVSYTPEKSYNSVVVSCPGITEGQTYTLTAGSQATTIEMTDMIYNAGGMGGKPGGDMHGRSRDMRDMGGMGTPPDAPMQES